MVGIASVPKYLGCERTVDTSSATCAGIKVNPTTMITMVTTLASSDAAVMSPYPTVSMVVNVQYSDAMYCVCTVASDTPNSIVHVRMPLTNPDASSSRPAWVPSGPTPVTWGLVK